MSIQRGERCASIARNPGYETIDDAPPKCGQFSAQKPKMDRCPRGNAQAGAGEIAKISEVLAFLRRPRRMGQRLPSFRDAASAPSLRVTGWWAAYFMHGTFILPSKSAGSISSPVAAGIWINLMRFAGSICAWHSHDSRHAVVALRRFGSAPTARITAAGKPARWTTTRRQFLRRNHHAKTVRGIRRTLRQITDYSLSISFIPRHESAHGTRQAASTDNRSTRRR